MCVCVCVCVCVCDCFRTVAMCPPPPCLLSTRLVTPVMRGKVPGEFICLFLVYIVGCCFLFRFVFLCVSFFLRLFLGGLYVCVCVCVCVCVRVWVGVGVCVGVCVWGEGLLTMAL